MAVLASRWEARSNMIYRRFSVVVVGLVAGHACRAGQVVVVVDVALRARRSRVEARQCPPRAGMVKLAIRPQNGVMAAGASRREAQRNVVDWRLRVVVVRLMARDAGRIRQVVVVVDVALRARRGRMEARQRPSCSSVVEFTVRPQHGVVAIRASRRET